MIPLLVKSLLFSIVVPGTVAFFIPLLITQGITIHPGWTSCTGLLFMILGLAIYGWCVWDFIVYGKGTPAPIDAPKRLVVRGLYHYTRNPMYVGILIIILSWGLLFSSLMVVIYAGCVAICLQLFVIGFEEPALYQLFGNQYDEYKSLVHRWLPIFLQSLYRSNR